jgi:hypothetical protein
MQFKVPCECGRQLTVGAGDAGVMLRCECGRDVQVPGLRELRASVPESKLTKATQPGNLYILRIVGPLILAVAFVWQCLAPFPFLGVYVRDRETWLWLMLSYSFLYFAGFIVWAAGKGYRPLYGVLLAILGPIGLIVLIFFPSRERQTEK